MRQALATVPSLAGRSARSNQVPATLRSRSSGWPKAGFQVVTRLPAGSINCTEAPVGHWLAVRRKRSVALAGRLHSVTVDAPAAAAKVRPTSGWRSSRLASGTWRAVKRTVLVAPSGAALMRTV